MTFQIIIYMAKIAFTALGLFITAGVMKAPLNLAKSIVAAILMSIISAAVTALFSQGLLWMLVELVLCVLVIKLLSGTSFWTSVIISLVGSLVGGAVALTLMKIAL